MYVNVFFSLRHASNSRHSAEPTGGAKCDAISSVTADAVSKVPVRSKNSRPSSVRTSTAGKVLTFLVREGDLEFPRRDDPRTEVDLFFGDGERVLERAGDGLAERAGEVSFRDFFA